MNQSESAPSISSALGGIFSWAFLFGSIVMFFTLITVVGNEVQTLQTTNDLVMARQEIVKIDPANVDPANEGKLVYVTGTLSSDKQLRDPEFGVPANALFLKRRVEMYQWDEICTEVIRKKNGVPISTTRSYAQNRIWHPEPINSSRFQNSTAHRNPPMESFRPRSWSERSTAVHLGAFTLRTELLDAVYQEEPLVLSEVPPAFSSGPYGSTGARIFENGVYLGNSPSQPQIGDRRIRYYVVKPMAVALIARQQGNTFVPFVTRNGTKIELIDRGKSSPEELLSRAGSQVGMSALVQRLLAIPFLMLGIGLLSSTGNLARFFLPGFASIAQCGTFSQQFSALAGTSLCIVLLVWAFVQSTALGLLVFIAIAAAVTFLLKGRES